MSKYIVTIIVLAAIVAACAPWMSAKDAESVIKKEFAAKWDGVQDGCGPIKNIRDTKRVPFGFVSSIQYDCGLKQDDLGQSEIIHKDNWHSVYVSFLMTSYGDFKK